MKQGKLKTILTFVFVIIGLFGLYTGAGVLARRILLDSSKPFSTWTYALNPAVNVWTSWDSGFYYDLANNGYPKIENSMKVAYINVLEGRWLKIFMGGGLVGYNRFALPSSSPEAGKVSNTVFVIGGRYASERLPIYNGYVGIPYCLFSGPIDYTRDVEVAKEALSSPTACGDSSCDRSYLTYYSMESRSVVYQEYFAKGNAVPVRTSGTERPLGNTDTSYMGYGCKSVGEGDIDMTKSTDFRNQFTNLPFGPLYPWLTKGLSMAVGDIVVGGLILSLIFFGLSALVFYKLSLKFLPERSSVWALLAYVLNPLTFFNFSFLPVSLFNLLFLSIIYFAFTKKFIWSIIFLPLLILTSIFGIFALVPLWFLYFTKTNEDPLNKVSILPYILSVTAAFLGVFANVGLIYLAIHDFFALITSRTPWWGGAQSFIGGFVTYFVQFSLLKIPEIMFVFIVIGGLLFLRNKALRSLSVGCATMLGLTCLLNGGLTGITKYYVLAFPLFIYLGGLMESKKMMAKLMVVLGLLIGIVCMALWTISSRLVV